MTPFRLFIYIFGVMLMIGAALYGFPMLFNMHSDAANILILALVAMICAFVAWVCNDILEGNED